MREKITFPLFIPSRNRLNPKELLMSKQVQDAFMFVEPQDYPDYKAFYGRQFKLVNIEENDRGFGYVCNFMLAYAQKMGFEHYCFCDDDVESIKHRYYPRSRISWESFFRDGVNLMDKEGYSQLMMSFAGHNWYYKRAIKEKIGAWCVVINKTADLIAVGGYDENLSIFNDWDMSASLIKKGFKTACWYDYMFSHKMKSKTGGAEEIYKNQKIIDSAIERLQKKYGDQVVYTVNSHNQVEARFNWARL